MTAPSLRVIGELLLENRGLVTLTPVVVVGLAGAVLLYRQGRRAEGVLVIGISTAFLVFNAGLTTEFGGPFGGDTPGPRYLIAALPFALAPIGPSYRRSPGTTIALLLISLVTMALGTLAGANSKGEVLPWLGDVLSGRRPGYGESVPFLLALGLALAATAVSLRSSGTPGRLDLAEGVTAFALWLALAVVVRVLVPPASDVLGSAALALVFVAVAVTVQVLIIRALSHDRAARAQTAP